MDHKLWLWKKKSNEKAIDAANNSILSSTRNEDELAQTLLAEKTMMERDVKSLSNKLSSAVSMCKSKDDPGKQLERIALEAIAGWEKADKEAISLKQELDKLLQERLGDEERLHHSDAALKECMQQLHFLREDQDKRISNAVMKASEEFERTRNVLEENLAESNKRLARLVTENNQLAKSLLVKEKTIGDLNDRRTQAEADFSALTARLESVERDNTSLKYEVRVLEKELEIRNEEREFNRRTADIAHKHNLENVKKIAKLESECQRLRQLIWKRLPGPATLARMKNEVEMLGRDQAEIRRRKSNVYSVDSADFSVDSSDTLSQRISFLTDELSRTEEQNRMLKEALDKKTNELQSYRNIYARMAPKLSEVDKNFEELPRGDLRTDHGKNQQEVSVTSMSDIGSDDKVSSAESWASALISELEHFKGEKQSGLGSCRSVEALDMSLMDDFVEMEKLATGSIDDTFGNKNQLQRCEADSRPLRSESGGYSTEATNGKIHQVYKSQPNALLPELDGESNDILIKNASSTADKVLNLILELSHVMQRKPDDILEDLKSALDLKNDPIIAYADTSEGRKVEALDLPQIGTTDFQVSMDDSSKMGSFDGESDKSASAGMNVVKSQSNISESLRKMIELIESISNSMFNKSRLDISSSEYRDPTEETAYVVRVFQWKESELQDNLQQFIQTVDDTLNGKGNFESFTEQITCTLEWILNHCFSIQDVSSMKDAIKSHLDWEDTRSENEPESRSLNHFIESDKIRIDRERSYMPVVSLGHFSSYKAKETQLKEREINQGLTDKMVSSEPTTTDLEGKLQSEISRSESLMVQLLESQKTINCLKGEVESLQQQKGMPVDQSQISKVAVEDLQLQFTGAKRELDEARLKISYLEKELDKHKYCFSEMDATCLKLHCLPESMEKNFQEHADPETNSLQNELEIAAASEKLAECQETIVNLGKQLKALASPQDSALFDKVISTSTDGSTTIPTPNKNFSRRSSLLEKMRAEDDADIGDPNSVDTKEIILDCNTHSVISVNGTTRPTDSVILERIKQLEDDVIAGSLAIAPIKKRNRGGLFMKLFCRPRKGDSKKMLGL